MATVYFGRLLGPIGFNRTVAIKRLHPQFAKEPEFVEMFLDEARVAARVKHPNVVSILDVVAHEGELFLVMEYVPGESLSRLLRLAATAGQNVPLPILSAITIGMLCGLHAAHEACDELGDELHIVHRDVSPQNVLVGADGVARLLDFGIAKAVGRLQTTREGQFKGKLAYMAPEQIVGGAVDRRCDVFSAGVLLWSSLTGAMPFVGGEASVMYQILNVEVARPSSVCPSIPPELDALVLRAMARRVEHRFPTALEMATELERIVPPATQLAVGAWVTEVARNVLEARAEQLRAVEGSAPCSVPPPRDPSALEGRGHTDLTGLAGATPQYTPDVATLTSSVVSRRQAPPGKTRWVALGVGGMTLGAVALLGQLAPTFDRPMTTFPSLPVAAPVAPAPTISVSPVSTSAEPAASATSLPVAPAQPRSSPQRGSSKQPDAARTAETKKPDYGF